MGFLMRTYGEMKQYQNYSFSGNAICQAGTAGAGLLDLLPVKAIPPFIIRQILAHRSCAKPLEVLRAPAGRRGFL
jgi:hypothetical protein